MAPQVGSNLIELYPRREQYTARWIIGTDAYAGQEYLFHAEYPAFVAKIGQSVREGIHSRPFHATEDNRCYYDFVWLDPQPDEMTFGSLMREAEDAFKARRFE